MPSHLSDYYGCATDRITKFHRAVESFLSQTYNNTELIIISDGCLITNEEVSLRYKYNDNIKLIPIEKQPIFSGNVRNIGCGVATGEILAYLDTDDIILANHLDVIVNSFNENKEIDWVYFDDSVVYRFHPTRNEMLVTDVRITELEKGMIGTSSIAHKKMQDINWLDCDGYGHDWTFIKKLIDSGKPYIKIKGCQYYVCHIPQSVDC